MAVCFALTVAVNNTARSVQNKLLYLRYKTDPILNYVETGLQVGLFQMSFALFFIASDHPSTNNHNQFFALLGSFIGQICSLLCFNSSGKGLVGPAVATFQAQNIFQIVLEATFLSIYPSLMQFLACLMCIVGVAVMMLFR